MCVFFHTFPTHASQLEETSVFATCLPAQLPCATGCHHVPLTDLLYLPTAGSHAVAQRLTQPPEPAGCSLLPAAAGSRMITTTKTAMMSSLTAGAPAGSQGAASAPL